MGIGFIRLVAIVLILVLAWPEAALGEVATSDDEAVPTVVISEVQAASVESATEEFVELYNNAAEPVDLEGWQVVYLSASGKTKSIKATIEKDTQLEPGEFFLLATEGYLQIADTTLEDGMNDSEGQVCLVAPGGTCGEESNDVADAVGWGSAAFPEQSSAVDPGEGSIQRCIEQDAMTDTNNNADDFAIYDEITPGDAYACETTPDDGSDEEPDENPPTIDVTCDGIMISEVLPNAAGSDTGNEFIELYNPTTDFIDLAGCGVQLGNTIYRFDDITLEPEEYRAFSDVETGVTLPNAKGGTLYLLTADDTELQELVYPGALDDDVGWAWFGSDSWEQTYSPTPGESNVSQPVEPCPVAGQVRSPETGRCSSPGKEESGLKPCAPDQFRNPATNRCKKKSSTENSLKPCAPDQFRNPETNRCKKKASDEDELKPCDPDQYRNPETNRCKKKDSAANQLKPCKPNQERNPETNRCRKKAGAVLGSDTDVKDIQAPTSSSTSWWIAGMAATSAAGYGLWEWRRDLARAASRLSRKLTSSSAQ